MGSFLSCSEVFSRPIFLRTCANFSILDALLAVKIPTIEVHITNIYNREDFREKSLISKAAKGIICGFGINGYIMALDSMKNLK